MQPARHLGLGMAGEYTANTDSMPCTDRRPQNADRDALTQSEVEELRRNLARLSTDSVEHFYREAHADCAVERKPGREGDSAFSLRTENTAQLELA
jgi:hypothetical protein